MNLWTELSIDYACQKSYLDDLFRIYPTIPENIRDIDQSKWGIIEQAFNARDNFLLLNELLKLDLFPIKDSYVAYLKRDISSLQRNPETVDRLCSRLYQMGLSKIEERCAEPKETNRQIGPLFTRWLHRKELGFPVYSLQEFIESKDNAILGSTDSGLLSFASRYLGFKGTKGLDFIARIHNKYVIGEAKFLTDFGGHQNAQFNDAFNLLMDTSSSAIKIAILDGVLYIPNNGKMFSTITKNTDQYNIMSSLVLREFLFQI